jgi:hypothetical protein
VELIGYAAGIWFCACVLAGVLHPVLRALRWLSEVPPDIVAGPPPPES